VFAQLGVPAAGNTPGGRDLSISWTDNDGNLWLYGSEPDGFDSTGADGFLDDVWEYNTTTQEWTWMAGSSALPTSGPSGVGGFTLSGGSSSDCLACAPPAVFGAYQTPSPEVTPGSLQYPNTWVDKQGNLWLFGGFEYYITGTSTNDVMFNALWKFDVSIHEWAWMGGSNELNPLTPGVYGKLGQPASGNTPGARRDAASWIDSSGNLWLFGGDGQDSAGTSGYLNDLWMFNPSISQWTWMGGSSTFSDGCINGTSVCSASGVPGTLGTAAPGNIPQGRSQMFTWTDKSGNVWIFGGGVEVSYDFDGFSGLEGTYINDLWKFNSSTHQWAWMSGNSAPTGNAPEFGKSPGVYGTLGTPSAINIPGGRSPADSAFGGDPAYTWTDSSDNLWLFGGEGFDSTTTTGVLNDLWKFDTSLNEWAWMGGGSKFVPNCITGSLTCSQHGVYGKLGTPAAGNVPGARAGAVQWADQSGNIWLFGGWGADSVGTWGTLNDLWEFNPATNLWTWMSGGSTVPNDGSNSNGQYGIYGSWGVRAATNVPGGREPAASWIDSSGNLWVFGGYGCSSNYCEGWLNDLWEYGSNALETPSAFFLSNGPGGIDLPVSGTGGSGTLTINSTTRGGFNSAIALSASGQPAGVDVSFNPASITGAGTSTMTITASPAVAFGNYRVAVTGTSGSESETATVTIVPYSTVPAATPTFRPPGGAYTAAQSVTIGDTTPGATIYYTTDQTTPTINSKVYGGPIGVSSLETIQAIAVAPKYPQSSVATATYAVSIPVAAAPTFSLASGAYAAAQTVAISDTSPGVTIYYTTDGTAPTVTSAVFGPPITISSSTVLKAMAAAGNYLNSAVATADYTMWPASATDEWAWMGGPVTPQPPVYGTLGTPAAGNLPGNRDGSTTWTDSSGNLWLFGGNGIDSTGRINYLNDLWEYNPSTGQWTWMSGANKGGAGVPGTKGTPAAGNTPAGRQGAVAWTDANGNFWLFGGFNYYTGLAYLNDLWEFSPSTNEWTWVGGANAEVCGNCNQTGVYGSLGAAAAGNIPGGRTDAVSWTDNKGNLWLFSGNGVDSKGAYGFLNDLWEFSPSTSQWVWMGGSNTIGKQGVYGAEGKPAAGNIPGARYSSSGWTDSTGNFWLFAGLGVDSAGKQGLLDDLWEFSPSSNQWAWMGGSSTYPATCVTMLTEECGTPGSYGAMQAPSSSNFPGARRGGAKWTDGKGNLWLFGGDGIDSGGTWGYLNDLWEFNPSTNTWTWMSGNNTVICGTGYCDQPGIYGIYQRPAFGNSPSGRTGVATWTDGRGDLWLFGGVGVDEVGTWADFQDLWEFQPGSGSLPAAAAPVFSPASGTFTAEQFVTISDPTPGAAIYYSISGATSAALYTAPIPVTSSETIEAYAVASGFSNSSLATATYTMNTPVAAAPTFNLATGTYATAQTLTISDASPGVTIYFTTDGTAPAATSAIYGTPIAISSSTVIQAIAAGGNYLNSAVASAVYTIGSTSTLGEWAWMGGSNSASAPASYGWIGVPAPSNTPGARSGSVRWTDRNGNLWLFGGTSSLSFSAQFEDLWEFAPSKNEWTCIGGRGVGSRLFVKGEYGTLGTPAPTNLPGGRSGSASWIDSSGDLWLFGGYGYDSTGVLGELNDLWRYDPPTNRWTWMGGSSQGVLSFYGSYGQPGVYGTLGAFGAGNIPGSRSNAASWIDSSGNLWLFGGVGQDVAGDSVTLNDMWEFSPAANQWAWMGGGNFLDPDLGTEWGVYGTLGQPAPANIPTSRQLAATWTDSSGNFWLFGGSDPFGSAGENNLNDLWRFNPSTKEWTWMSGPSSIPCIDYAAGTGLYGGLFCGQLSVNGTLGVPAPGNFPGGRAPAANWIDGNGNLWLFGGKGLDHAGEVIDGLGVDPSGDFIGPINDLWYYTPSTGMWTWMGGNVSTSGCFLVVGAGLGDVMCGGQPGTYGTLQTPAGGDVPGSRTSAVGWTDARGNLWLFSGWGQGDSFLADVETYPLNDVWEYRPSAAALPATPAPVFGTMPGTYTSGVPVTIFDAMPNASIYYTTDGTTPTVASTPFRAPITVSSSETIEAIATATGYAASPVTSAAYTVTLPQAATPAFSLASGTYTKAESVTITDATSGASIYYTTDGVTIPTTASHRYQGAITVGSTETIMAVAVSSGHSNSALASATYIINLPPAAMPVFKPAPGTYHSAQSVTITDTTSGASIFYTTDGVTMPTASSSQYKGAIQVSSTETLKAIAVGGGYSPSAVATAAYSIVLPQTISLQAPPSPVSYGVTPIKLNATASSGLPVTFTATGPESINGSTLTITGAGTVTVTANQAGNGNYSAATAVSKAITVNKATPTVGLKASAASLAYGAPVTLTASLSNAGSSSVTPTGTVTFLSSTTSLGTGTVNAGGVATLTLTTLAVGTDSITASYGGDTRYATAKSSSASVVVGKAAQTTIFAAPVSPAAYGITPIKLSATASSGLAVTFTATGPATVSGNTLTISATGKVVVTANQSGNIDYAAAPAVSQTIIVNPGTANGKLTSSAASVTYGSSVTLTATFSGSGSAKPSGTVTFLSGSTSLGSGALNTSGVATLALTTLPAGTGSLTANFPGDTCYSAAATAPITETVKQATPAVKLTSSASTVVYGASVTLTAILSGTGAKPSGTVAFYNGATPIGTSTLNASGVATLRITTLPVGANSIKASYGGNANYVAATSTATTVTIGKGTQTIAFTTPTTPVKYGVAPIVLIATGGASGLPVTFTVTGPASVSGGALTITGAGSVAVTANQAGNSNYAAAAAVSRTITVNKATPANILTTPAASVAAGSSVPFTAIVTGVATGVAPSGTVTFLDGTTLLSTGSLANGVATCSTAKLAIGKHTVTAKYGGDANYVTVTSAAVIVTVAAK
jgi:N-acetylneuraminic acid mutarotase